ncbi:MAG TPA: hypothetical protein VIA06_08470 [Candidatus Dormibacteraeota bacterium]|jgi:hypothetical protein|nr:hypothetical protein [Candidatus Dormibacteraeota bacterium]
MATSDFPSQLSNPSFGRQVFHEGIPSWLDVFAGFGRKLRVLFTGRTPPGDIGVDEEELPEF